MSMRQIMFEFDFDIDYEEHLQSLGELVHEPIQPARPHHEGEQVYLYQWQQLLSYREEGWPPNAKLAIILFDLPHALAQRHATVAASFITWLGTNAGMSFRSEARRLKNIVDSFTLEQAFTAAWSIGNIRQHHRNGRNIDHILAPEDHYGEDLVTGHVRLLRQPHVTGEDLEVLDVLVRWLSTDEASEFVAECERLIEIRQRFRDPLHTIKIVTGVAS